MCQGFFVLTGRLRFFLLMKADIDEMPAAFALMNLTINPYHLT